MLEGQEVGGRLNVDEIAGVTCIKLMLMFREHILYILCFTVVNLDTELL